MSAWTQRIGVGVDDFRLPIKEGLARAARLGFNAVELGAGGGEIAPARLSESGRRHLARMCGNLGLTTAALTADVGGPGLSDAAGVSARVELTVDVLTLAADLHVPVVCADVGQMVDPNTGEPDPVALDAIKAIGERADRLGTIFAIQTGADAPEHLAPLLSAIACPSLAVCMDPARLIGLGHDPMAGLQPLAEWIMLSHLGDATRGRPGHAGIETPLGQGQLDLPRYLAELSATPSNSPLILRRRDSRRPIDDLAAAMTLLQSLTR